MTRATFETGLIHLVGHKNIVNFLGASMRLDLYSFHEAQVNHDAVRISKSTNVVSLTS